MTTINVLNETDAELTLENGDVVVLRTDIPLGMIMPEESEAMLKSAVDLHMLFKAKLTEEISLDSYIQVGSKDSLIIGNEAERYSIVYPNGSFNKFSPLFYLDWALPGMVIEVTEDINNMAKFIYKKTN